MLTVVEVQTCSQGIMCWDFSRRPQAECIRYSKSSSHS